MNSKPLPTDIPIVTQVERILQKLTTEKSSSASSITPPKTPIPAPGAIIPPVTAQLGDKGSQEQKDVQEKILQNIATFAMDLIHDQDTQVAPTPKPSAQTPQPPTTIFQTLKVLLIQKINNGIPEVFFHTTSVNFYKSIRARFMALRGISHYSNGNLRWREMSEEMRKVVTRVFRGVMKELKEMEKEGKVTRCKKNDVRNERRRMKRRQANK